MAKIINPSKLLPSAKSTAIARVVKPKSVNILAKTSPLYKGSSVTRQSEDSKDTSDINNKLVKIDKFLKSDLIVSQKKAEVKRKGKEKQDFDEAEKKLETPKLKGFKLPSLGLPSLGFFDRVKRFLFFTALGWLLPKIIEFLPKLEGFAKIVGGIYNFAEGLFGKLFDGFMSLVKFGGDLKDKTLGFIASAKAGVGGNYQKEFDKLEKQFNTFVNASIIAGVLAADIGSAAVDEYNKQRGKVGKPKPGEPTKPGAKPVAKAGAKITTGRGGEKPKGKPKVTESGKPGKPSKPPRLKGPFAKFGKLLGKFSGVAIPGLGAVIGEMDARARFAGGDNVGGWMARISAILDGFSATAALGALATSALTLTGVGAAVPAALATAAGVAGTASMIIDGILFVRDLIKTFLPQVPMFSRGGRVVRRYQGGGTTRGGRPVGTPVRRTITPTTRKKPTKVQPPKSQPGKDVGGEGKIKRLYPDTDPKKINLNQWIAGNFAGTYQQYLQLFGKADEKKPNPYKALTTTAKILKDLPFGLGHLMGGAVDLALGQSLDVKKAVGQFSSGISYLVEGLVNQKTNQSITSLMKDISTFAGGGNIPPSRELKGTYSSMGSGDLIAKVLEPTMQQKVNEVIQSIEKQLQIQTGGAGGRPTGSPSPDDAGDGGPSAESIDMSGLSPEDVDALGRMVQAEAGNQSDAGKAAVMNVILNRYRLAKSGRGYLPRGKTKDTVTLRDILYAPNQFSPIGDGRFDRTSSASGKSALAKAISAGGNDPEKLKRTLMEKYNLSEQDANYVVVSTAFSNPQSRDSRPFDTKEVTVGDHTFQESPNARLTVPGQKIDANVKTGIIKGGPIKGGAIIRSKGDPDAEQTGSDISVGNYQVGAHIQNPFQSLKITGVGFQGSGSGDSGSGYGNYVTGETVINGKRYEVLLGHLDKSLVKKGDILEVGDVIGTQGISGHATGPHVTTHVNALNGGNPSNVLFSIENVWKNGGVIETKSMGEPTSKRQAEKPKPGQQPISSSQQSRENILKALSQKGDIPLTVNGESYFFKVDPSQRNPYKVFKRNLLGLGSSEIDITGDKNKAVQDAMRDKIRTMYAPAPSRGRETGYGELVGGKGQGGAFIGPSKPNRPIPNSFAPYETYGSGMMIAIQPIIVEKQVPVSGGGNKMIAFPVPVAVNSNMDLSLSRG